jgi:hypothetical protein
MNFSPKYFRSKHSLSGGFITIPLQKKNCNIYATFFIFPTYLAFRKLQTNTDVPYFRFLDNQTISTFRQVSFPSNAVTHQQNCWVGEVLIRVLYPDEIQPAPLPRRWNPMKSPLSKESFIPTRSAESPATCEILLPGAASRLPGSRQILPSPILYSRLLPCRLLLVVVGVVFHTSTATAGCATGCCSASAGIPLPNWRILVQNWQQWCSPLPTRTISEYVVSSSSHQVLLSSPLLLDGSSDDVYEH